MVRNFRTHQGRYSSPRLHAQLRDRGRNIARKRVARLIREAGLCAKRKLKRVLTTHRDSSHPVAPNCLHQKFTAQEPNKKWVTDVRP
jgi:putative transposase